ncbi:MAG: prepilin peptidase [Armatimonadota bacterium]|nr:prepilin peptidase [Armatimonadota bacterium]
MAIALAVLLTLAAVCDIRTHRVPNLLVLTGLGLGLAGHGWRGGGPGLLESLEGIAVAVPLLLLYALGGLGAGDVKLLGAVGALMGPIFLLWTLLGTVLAGGLLALIWAMTRGVLRETVQNTVLGLHLLGAGAGVSSLASVSKAGRMPLAPAIALGAAFAFFRLHLRLSL